MVAYASPVLDLVGNTPLLRLRSDGDALLVGKLELVNPGGSVKDRIAVRMVDAAGRSGGGSSGMAVVAARQVAAAAGPGGRVVVLLPDGGRGYLSKIFDDRWM